VFLKQYVWNALAIIFTRKPSTVFNIVPEKNLQLMLRQLKHLLAPFGFQTARFQNMSNYAHVYTVATEDSRLEAKLT
jgi:folylpolyglutamate synthase/dihydropteroate synthase